MERLQVVVNHKNKKYEYFLNKYPEFEQTIWRFQDYIQRVFHNEIVETRFLSTIEQTILLEMVDNDIQVVFSGGFINAKYQRAELSLKYFYLEQLPKVTILQASFNSNFNQITHRDVLGAILNVGLQRNRIGDIFIQDSMIYVACDPEVVVILKQVNKMKRSFIQFEEVNKKITLVQNFETYEVIISSLRLDNLVAKITHLSRQKAVDLIVAGYVKVNSVIQEEKTYNCLEEDELVIRGYGKYLIDKIKYTTKKNNLVLQIKKYI